MAPAVREVRVRRLTRDECVRLDDYLHTHKLGDAGVLIAYDRRAEYVRGAHPEAQLAQLQGSLSEQREGARAGLRQAR